MHHSWPATPGAPDRRRASGYLKDLVLKTSYSLFYSLFAHDMIGGGLGMGAPRAPSLCPLCPYLHNPTWGFTQRYKKGTRCTVSVRLERYLPTFIASSLLLFRSPFPTKFQLLLPFYSLSPTPDVVMWARVGLSLGECLGRHLSSYAPLFGSLGGIMSCPRES